MKQSSIVELALWVTDVTNRNRNDAERLLADAPNASRRKRLQQQALYCRTRAVVVTDRVLTHVTTALESTRG